MKCSPPTWEFYCRLYRPQQNPRRLFSRACCVSPALQPLDPLVPGSAVCRQPISLEEQSMSISGISSGSLSYVSDLLSSSSTSSTSSSSSSSTTDTFSSSLSELESAVKSGDLTSAKEYLSDIEQNKPHGSTNGTDPVGTFLTSVRRPSPPETSPRPRRRSPPSSLRRLPVPPPRRHLLVAALGVNCRVWRAPFSPGILHPQRSI